MHTHMHTHMHIHMHMHTHHTRLSVNGNYYFQDQDVMKKWWAYMEPLMECNADHSPKVTELKCVFHME